MIKHRAGLVLATVTAAGALGAAGTAIAATPRAVRPAGTSLRAVRHGDAVPTTMTGQKIAAQADTDKPGTVLGAKDVGYPRVFSSSRTGLAIGADSQGTNYAAISTNGGSTWKVASPALFTATADAPNAVSSVATAGPKIDIVYGPECIDVTGNGGSTWYRVYPDGYVTAVVQGQHGIAAYVQITGNNDKILATDEYVSTNAGRSWKLENVLGG